MVLPIKSSVTSSYSVKYVHHGYRETINKLDLETLEHTTNSPNLTSLDYYLFEPFKEAWNVVDLLQAQTFGMLYKSGIKTN